MKNVPQITQRFIEFSLIACALLSAAARPARANSELDRRYQLSSVGLLRPWDNVDGLFADYVVAAYRDYFAHQSRFVTQDLSKSEQVIAKSRLPYKKIVEDPVILSQLARSARVDTLIRTRIVKAGPQYSFKLEWLLAPNMRQLSEYGFTIKGLDDPGAMGALHAELQKALHHLIVKVPFVAAITGRDGKSVTVNIGANLELRRGDTLVVATLDEVKEHPLLKSIVDWRLTRTGKLEIDQVEEMIAFAHIVEEDENRQVARDQKIIQVLPKPPEPDKPTGELVEDAEGRLVESKDPKRKEDALPSLGYVSGGLSFGGFSRDKSSANGTQAFTASGSYIGADADGQIWFNRNAFADLGIRYGAVGFKQINTLTGADSLGSSGTSSSSALSVKLDAGYSYLLSDEFFGPKGWAKLGYHSFSYNLPTLSPTGGTAAQIQVESSSPINFKTVFIGLGADVPVAGDLGVQFDLNFGVFTSASEGSKLTGDVASASHASFFLGGYYRHTRRITFRLGLNVESDSAEFANNISISQKIITFSPAIQYYF